MNIKLLIYSLFCITFSVVAQPPNGYYSSATGSGYTLKTQLRNIITNGHSDQGYSALYTAYEKTDTDNFFENDGTVLDMYSENPNGTDPYNYTHGNRQCGNYNSENDCYNREHIFPQGFFNEQSPMRSDVHHVVPTDGSVNGRRNNYPFGEVSNPTYTSLNGSKVGNNTAFGYNGTVFEPIDEFKGDIARMLLYFATRYENEVTSSSWDSHTSNNNPLDGTNDQVYESWYIRLLYKWHLQDPVSQREIVRNNEAYDYQGNRNPFIDNPDYVAQIWGNVLNTDSFQLLQNITVFPNPSDNQHMTISVPDIIIDNMTVYSIIGKKVLEIKNPSIINEKIDIQIHQKGIYLLRMTSNEKSITKKLIFR